MIEFDPELLKDLHKPLPGSHKGQNGKVLLIGGSHLFHAASLWSLQIASKLVDMVFYASIPENNQIVQQAKEEFRNGMVIERKDIEDYIEEADVILIGPGMVRTENTRGIEYTVGSVQEAFEAEHEGMQTYHLTKYLLNKYPHKKWVIDGGALQMIEVKWLSDLKDVILTPHLQEFQRVFDLPPSEENVVRMAVEHRCVILRKGQEDIVASLEASAVISGGNAGMTKGGTGDVLAGLVAGLFAKNDAFLAASAGSYINKKAGEYLFEKQGYVYNSSDLVDAIPIVMKEMR